MKYYSLNRNAPEVSFKDATIGGQAPDKGLYFPKTIPQVERSLIDNIEQYSNEAIALEVIKPYIGDAIDAKSLQRIVEETLSFDIPLVQVNKNIFSLELFHGPTLAFKDVGARFMSRCLGYFLKDSKQRVVVLVATSGDTGGAVANGFYEVEGVDVVVLYPSKKVSAVQEAQIATLGKNIHAIEVDGTFDDCQQMVKAIFADKQLNEEIFLTSANSINVARWLPQQFYYFFAWKQWKDKLNPPVISVPSGNFGNICAGLLANKSGLPVKHFIAACNANKVVLDYLLNGEYKPQPATATISNAMDVGDPSNFVRILELFQREFGPLKNCMSSDSISDADTKTIIKQVYERDGYLLDPHGAVGYLALERFLAESVGDKGIFLETAHPVKFNDTIIEVLQTNVLAQKEASLLLGGEKKSILMQKDVEALKTTLKKICS